MRECGGGEETMEWAPEVAGVAVDGDDIAYVDERLGMQTDRSVAKEVLRLGDAALVIGVEIRPLHASLALAMAQMQRV
jgi:hypothetical protein